MAKYIKMTNGAVTFLVNVTDVNEIEEKDRSGFKAELDKDGEVVLVDSSTLGGSENEKIANILESVKRQAVASGKTGGTTSTANGSINIEDGNEDLTGKASK